jgi:uncharacterized protein (UPF0303 family)
MGLEHDIERIGLQEQRLRFERFDQITAWQLGHRIIEMCEARKVALTVELRLLRETVFFYAMPGTGPSNADWARRKRNTVELLQRSSYGVGRSLELEGLTLEQKMGLPLRDYASHGGGFPLWVNAVGCVGCVTVSGVPQREDHGIVVAALASLCNVALNEVALD